MWSDKLAKDNIPLYVSSSFLMILFLIIIGRKILEIKKKKL